MQAFRVLALLSACIITSLAQGQPPEVLPRPSLGIQAPISAASETARRALSLDDLLGIANQNNPTLRQAKAQITATYGKALEAGLYPNPTVGYSGEQIGVEGTAGEFQGGFIQQEIVTAGKLKLSREKYLARARAAERQATAQQQRVYNDLRGSFYQTWRSYAKGFRRNTNN